MNKQISIFFSLTILGRVGMGQFNSCPQAQKTLVMALRFRYIELLNQSFGKGNASNVREVTCSRFPPNRFSYISRYCVALWNNVSILRH